MRYQFIQEQKAISSLYAVRSDAGIQKWFLYLRTPRGLKRPESKRSKENKIRDKRRLTDRLLQTGAYSIRLSATKVISYHDATMLAISLKLSKPASISSMISWANRSGSGRLSKSARLLSLSQKMSRLVLSLTVIS